MGLDWAAIRADYEARATPAELGPAKPPKAPRPRPSRASSAPAAYRTGPRPEARVVDYDEVVRLFRSGMRVKDIADRLECHRATVSRALTRANVDYKGRGGPIRKEVCHRGHSMSDALELRGGGRACRSCKKDRDRVNQRAKRERDREREAQAASGPDRLVA